MRYLILSDIHANLEALEAVLEAARGSYDHILCLGDIVGYGADPNAVTDWVRGHVTAIVRGNHDRACVGSDDLEWFNPAARYSALWTQALLTPENAAYLRVLPAGPMWVERFQVAHGSPLNEDEYLVNVNDAQQLDGYLEAPVCFFGHTHLQGGFVFHRLTVRRLDPPERHEDSLTVQLDPDAGYLINPGAVGQPRDGDPRAAFVLWTPSDRTVSWRRVTYDVDQAQSKIRAAGLPEVLASRLAIGH